jgi:hypothetical protein
MSASHAALKTWISGRTADSSLTSIFLFISTLHMIRLSADYIPRRSPRRRFSDCRLLPEDGVQVAKDEY